MIIQQEKAQDREKLLLKFIKIMKVSHTFWGIKQKKKNKRDVNSCFLLTQHLRKLNNFNSYLAILSALDSAPIRRLEWQKQTSEVTHRTVFKTHLKTFKEQVPSLNDISICFCSEMPDVD